MNLALKYRMGARRCAISPLQQMQQSDFGGLASPGMLRMSLCQRVVQRGIHLKS